jgi:sulfide:quinone oxidoreductase
MAQDKLHHKIVVVGGGTAGISVAARLRRAGEADVAVIEPSDTHYYQPLWTLVGGGRAPLGITARKEASVMPRGAAWIKARVDGFDPDNNLVHLATGSTVEYDYLVVCPGIQLDWDKIPGVPEAVQGPFASSNYTYDLAPKTWQLIKPLRRGTALFTMPAGPIKCAGAPQKIAYLACDYWRQQGVLADIRVVLVLPTPGMFGVKVFSDVLETVAARYGIEVHKSSELVEVDADNRTAVIVNHADESKEEITYDLMHVVPPQSAPDWVKASPLADAASPFGYVEIDKNTMRHVRYPNIFSLGDCGSSPNSKTGAAVRKQAPVVTANLRAVMANGQPTQQYDGYASCPLTTSRNRMLLAEFDYTMQPHPTIPLINTKKERYDMWLLKRYGLPFMYWNMMLKGTA